MPQSKQKYKSEAPNFREMWWQSLTKLNIHLPYDPEIPHPDIYPRQKYLHTHRERIPITALFITAQNGLAQVSINRRLEIQTVM